ncbi:ubinuclein-1-like [Aulostomus maculatus]
MAESRRVPLTTLTCDGPSPSDKPASVVRKSPSTGRSCSDPAADTVRLVLTLVEPDERNFPEFSYSQLINDQIIHVMRDEAPLSPLEAAKRESDGVADVARKLEEKYGNKRMKKRDRVQDLIDIGYGYDEEDSFIDNSEAYDEFVPSSISTKYGGFYINSGVLQFRGASDTENDDFTSEEKTMKSPKKGELRGPDKPKRKRSREGQEVKSAEDFKASITTETAAGEMKKKKRKNVAGTLSVTSMLRKFRREKERERQMMEKANQRPATMTGTPTIPLGPADAGGGGGSGLADPLLSLIGSTNDHALIQAACTVDFDIDLESLLDASEVTMSPKSVPPNAADLPLHQRTADGQSRPSAPSNVKAHPPSRKSHHLPRPPPEQNLSEAKPASPQCVPLPEGLPPELEDSVKNLMLVAKTSEGESKLKFFTPEINSALLDIEFQCREQGGQLRSKVYTHLSSFLPCSRDTLLKRVKKLLLAQAEDPPNEEDPMQKLKEAISRAMPEQITRFRDNCCAYEQMKSSKASEEGKDDTQRVNVGPDHNVVGKRGPRKLFKWNEELRECLCHVLQAKIDGYKKEKGSQEMEDYLKMLLDNDIKALWPKGWMQTRVLIRESRKMLGLFKSLLVKKSKAEKNRSSVSVAPSMSDGCSFLQAPMTGELPQETEGVVAKGSNVMNGVPLGTAKKQMAALKRDGKPGEGEALDAGSSTPVETVEPRVGSTSAPSCLARAQPPSVPQELLTAAVAKYKRSVKHWSFSTDTRSPPFPPPPPQSSPVNFPGSGACQVTLPLAVTRHPHAGQVQLIDDDDIIMY